MKVLIFTSQLYESRVVLKRLAIELVIDLNKHGIHADLLVCVSRKSTKLRKRDKL
jgi:hypothetical protein